MIKFEEDLKLLYSLNPEKARQMCIGFLLGLGDGPKSQLTEKEKADDKFLLRKTIELHSLTLSNHNKYVNFKSRTNQHMVRLDKDRPFRKGSKSFVIFKHLNEKYKDSDKAVEIDDIVDEIDNIFKGSNFPPSGNTEVLLRGVLKKLDYNEIIRNTINKKEVKFV